MLTDLSVYTKGGGLSGRRARLLCNDVMMSSIWIQEWSVCVYASLSPKRVSGFTLAAQEERRPKALVQSATPPPTPTPPLHPSRWGSITAERTVAPSRAVSEPKETRRRFNAPQHTPGTVKDYGRHIFIIVGGT